MTMQKQPPPDLYVFERAVYAQNPFRWICGADEAGRGPLAGPVFAAAVILPRDVEIAGLMDSKKLSAKKRELLYDEITKKAIGYGIASVDEKEIDAINILQASMLAMKMAIEQLPVVPDMAYIDGDRVPKLDFPATAVVKGDATSASIAAASILAKVARDRFMIEIAKEYPQYHFAKNKGYPTTEHYRDIAENGICDIHRKTFLKTLAKHQEK